MDHKQNDLSTSKVPGRVDISFLHMQKNQLIYTTTKGCYLQTPNCIASELSKIMCAVCVVVCASLGTRRLKILHDSPVLLSALKKKQAASNVQICLALVLPGSAFHYKVRHLPPTRGIYSFRPFILHTSQVREQLTGKTQIPQIIPDHPFRF